MILYIGNFLKKHGYTPTMGESLSEKLSKKYKVIKSSDKRTKFFRLLDMIFTFLVYSKKIRLVLIDTYSYQAFWYAYIIALLSKYLKVRYIPIIHGGNFESRILKSPGKTRYYLANAHKIVLLSKFMKDLMMKNGHNEVVEIPNYILVDDYKVKLRKSVSPKLLWVRSLHKNYNPMLAFNVVEKLINRGFDAKLCMVGPEKDGSLATIKRYSKEKGLEKHIELTGKLLKEEWCKLSEDYDIFINTTNEDNFPISVIESMALGLPVISTNVGGVPFIIDNGNNGLLVEPNDPEAFAKQIIFLIDNADIAKKISFNARQFVESLDWSSIKIKWYDLIDKALDKD